MNRILGWLLVTLVGLFGLVSAQAKDNAYINDWGPEVGTQAPLIIGAQDQTGVDRSFKDLSGDNGLLLFFVRSADW